MIVNIITGNENKVRELKKIFPTDMAIKATKIDLDEIQSLDTKKIISHKLRQAYVEIEQPVIVEDVSAELECLNGLPGPFIKFFEEQLGRGALYKLSYEEAKVKIRCTMGYFDGKTELIAEGIVPGTITAPRGGDGFGFDFVFIPRGYKQTFSEMGVETKNCISHRFLAAKNLLSKMQANNIL